MKTLEYDNEYSIEHAVHESSPIPIMHLGHARFPTSTSVRSDKSLLQICLWSTLYA